MHQRRVGLEMEMVVAHAETGVSQPVDRYFHALREVKRASGVAGELGWLGGRCVELRTAMANCGLDNGFNLLETATVPVDDAAGGLTGLARLAHAELADTLQALAVDDACILNASQHPACTRDRSWYEQVCVPRSIYRELRGHRRWRHREGIDAKAQNGPNTSVPVAGAVDALNVAIALAPASMALFANSPLESGRVTGVKENRMLLWERMFRHARFAGDRRLSRYPSRPFHGLNDFFMWMYGPGTVSRGLPLARSFDYKAVPTVLLEDDPCLHDFLHHGAWPGRRLDDDQPVSLVPTTHHFEYSQIGQFLDARLRYRFGKQAPLDELLSAWRCEEGLETLFEQCQADVYIEARAPGAGFADACLLREAGSDVAQTVLVAPAALQRGLLANLTAARCLVDAWGWAALGELRSVAIRDGLDDARVRALCGDVLALARDGLAAPERCWLAYAEFVLATGRAGADRLMDTWQGAGGSLDRRLAAVVAEHAALHPRCFPAFSHAPGQLTES